MSRGGGEKKSSREFFSVRSEAMTRTRALVKAAPSAVIVAHVHPPRRRRPEKKLPLELRGKLVPFFPI
jgi:hypothetical protein